MEAFYSCSGVTSLTIGSGLTQISNSAFIYCYNLTSLYIPDNVTDLGNDSAFKGCRSLSSVTICSDITSIKQYTFSDCSGLTMVTLLASTAPYIYSNTFKNVKTNGTLYVPIGSSGYDTWMQTSSYYLGFYNWTKVEQ